VRLNNIYFKRVTVVQFEHDQMHKNTLARC